MASSRFRKLTVAGLLALMVLAAFAAPRDSVGAASRVQYPSRAAFLAALAPGSAITDDYGAASGYPSGFGVYDNATMSAFFGETDYFTTGHSNLNIHQGSDTYCAGCNGSFRLLFHDTSVTVGGVGVYGVAVDVLGNDPSLPYHAYVTYGDGSTEDFPLPSGASFFGITSPDLIVSVHMGLVNGGATTNGSYYHDNLTIGAGSGGGPAGVRLVGTLGYGGTSSTLVELDPDSGDIIREIGPVGYMVNGLAFDSTTGKLYASTSANDPNFVGLIEIDMDTGEGRPVGEPRWGGNVWVVVVIAIDSGGQMYGWSGNGGNLVRIDKYSGVGEEICCANEYIAQHGLSFDSSDRLYAVNYDGNFYRVDPGSSYLEYEGNIGQGAHHGDFHPDTDLYYGLTWTYGDPRILLRCDLREQYCEKLTEVKDMHTLTFVLDGEVPPTATPTATPAVAQADLSITKSVSSSPLIAGQTGTYTIVSTNRGPGTATDVSITEYVVSGTEVQSVTCSGASINYLADRVVCTWAGATSVGASRTMVLTGRVCPELACGSSLRNTAETALNPQYGYDPNPSNNRIELSTPVEAQSSLSITMSDSPDPVIAGNNLTYNLVVRNSGPSNAQNVVVRQTLPAYTQFVSASSSPSGVTCSANGDQVTCNVGVLGAPRQCTSPRPEQYSITIVARVSDLAPSSVSPCTAPPLSSTAAIASGNCRPDTGTLSAVASTRVLAGADIVVDPAVVAGLDECIGPGAYLRVQHTFSNTGPRAYTPQRDNAGPEFTQILPAAVVGVNGSCTVLAGGGTCEIGTGQVGWNGTMAVGETVTIEYRVRVRGATMLGTEMCFGGEAHYDECNTGANTALATAEEDVCVEADCPSLITPNRQLGMQVHLPILNYLGNDDLCETWIEVQAVGSSPMKAVLVTWGEPGFCPPQAAGPLKVECTGLLMPGSTWNLLADQIPSGSKGGMLFKFSTKQLSDVGLDDTFGFDDILADLMCETLFFGVVGDADDFRRFKKAYNEGGNFGGIPQDVAAGWKEGGILAVDVLRDCPSPQAAGVRVTSKYNGIAASHLGEYDPVYGGYGYYVPLVYADAAQFNSWIYIQNGGLECSSVEIWLKDMEECLRATVCEVSTLAPGETLQLDPNDCVAQFVGSAWIRTSQPMAIAVDITGRDVLMTYVGEPAELNYTFDPEQATVSPGNQVAFGPLVYSEYQGWDSGVQVQNLSPVVNAKVKVYFLDRSGDVITTLVDWICPRGSQTFFLPVVSDLPGTWVGSLRVESQEWITPGGTLVMPPNIVGVATLIKYADAQRADTREAIAYNLLPEHKVFDWQLGGSGGGGLEAGVGLIAIPSLIKDLAATGVTSELAITNVVPKPGFTDFAIYIYDQNGLLDYVCEKLNEKQVEYIDLQSWGYVNNGFKGSAIISAVFWEHDVFDDDGFFLRNLVGLGAVAIERSRTRLEQDVAGDEAAGARGIPFKQSDIEDEEFEFRFMGPAAPLCPGVPENLRQKPGEGPTCLGPTGEEVQADWGGSRPVPLTYSQGTCNGTNPGQSHALENPDIAWDGTDGDILEFVNCANNTVEVNFYSGACPGASPYGMIIQFYQLEDGAPDPATPGGCTNLIFCKNPGTGGWCYSSSLNPSGCLYDVAPGIFEVLVQTDLIGGSCAPFSYSYTLTVP